jgi:hypothetical protein
MDKTTKVGLTAAALMACAPGAALAAPVLCGAGLICQTTTLSFTTSVVTLPFLGFTEAAAALGITGATLTDVSDALSASGSVSGTASNSTVSSQVFSVGLSDTVSKAMPAPIGTLTDVALAVTTTISAPSGGTASVSRSGSGTASASASAPTNLSNFLTNFTATGSDFGAFNVSASFIGTVLTTASVASGLKDILEYSFSQTTTTTTTTPEPATLSLLGSGLVGIGLARLARRRRKQ